MIDGIGNALKTSLSGTYTTGSTVLTLDNNEFSGVTKDHNLVIFDRKEGDPADAVKAGRMEIVRRDASADSGNDITVTRAQEGTSAIDFDANGDWVVILAPTKYVFDQIENAIDGKSGINHTHTEADITDLGNYAVVGHTHTESDITDLQNYLLNISGENLEDLSNVVTGAVTGNFLYYNGTAWSPVDLTSSDIPNLDASKITTGTFADARISQSSVTQHETAFSITESQISDFGSYEPAFAKNPAFNKDFGTTTGTVAEGNDSRILNGETAYGWGDHALANYETSLNADQKRKITYGTANPSGGSDGDIYLQHD